jgi:ABC-type transport system involved in multi-copper enzyme maturation permease subunit
MTFLPVIARELRVAARRKSTRRIRLLTTVAAILVVGVFLLVGPVFRGAGVGGLLFQIITGYAFGLCALAGVFVTSDCLSEEKRAGTLGLLFLTDLVPRDIVLGKFVARLLNPFLAWLAILPVISLSLLLGGVTAGEFWRVALALLNTLFLSLAIGLAVSAWSHDAQRAAGAVLGILVLLFAVLPVAHALAWNRALSSVFGAANWFSPFFSYRRAMDVVYAADPGKFWASLAVAHALGWLWLAIAVRTIRKTWQENPVIARPQITRQSQARRTLRRRAEGSPVYWLMPGSPGLEVMTWGIALTWAVVAFGALQFLPRGVAAPVSFFVAKGVGLLLKIMFVNQVCRFLVEARQSGSLEMLLCTPVTDQEIIGAHWRHLRRVFLGPVIVFLLPVFAATLLAQDFATGAATGAGPWPFSLMGQTVSVLLFIPTAVSDFLALGTVGLWLSLSMKKPSLAPGVTVVCVLLPPMFLFCIPDIFYNVLLFAWARERLAHDFRKRFSEQYSRTM